jgi:hypothetical protein
MCLANVRSSTDRLRAGSQRSRNAHLIGSAIDDRPGRDQPSSDEIAPEPVGYADGKLPEIFVYLLRRAHADGTCGNGSVQEREGECRRGELHAVVPAD